MDHSEIMGMITSPSSWEQVIYDVIAFEGLNPWDLDLKKLAEGFMKHVHSLEEMDFKVPAKYLMVAATLLRMKSDHMPILDYFQEEPDELDVSAESEAVEGPALNPLTIPPRRVPYRRIVVEELVSALRKALGTANRRALKKERAKGKIIIHQEDIGKRISALYERINNILSMSKDKEVPFSNVVHSWSKAEVAGTFLPLIHLNQQKKVECRQEEMFDEIYIKSANGLSREADKKAGNKAKKRRGRLNGGK